MFAERNGCKSEKIFFLAGKRRMYLSVHGVHEAQKSPDAMNTH